MKNYKKKQDIEFPVCLIEFLLAPETFGVCPSKSNCQNSYSVWHKSYWINRRQFLWLGFSSTLSPFFQFQGCIWYYRYRKFVSDQYIPNKRIIPSAREMFVHIGYFFPQKKVDGSWYWSRRHHIYLESTDRKQWLKSSNSMASLGIKKID